MIEAILRAVDLRKTFGHRRAAAVTVAVDGVSFELAEGEALGLVGESGSGKSTLASLLVGLERPSSGHIEVQGQRLSARRSRAQSKSVQMVFQDPYTSLDPRQTGEDALVEILRFHFGRSARNRTAARTLADQVGLYEDLVTRRPATLSGGQRQRLAIARALAVEPDVVIFDEAVSALDVSVQAQVLAVIKDLRRDRGMSYIFVTHDLAVARTVTDRLLVMRRGRVVEEGATRQVLSSPQHAYTRRLRSAVPGPGWKPGATERGDATEADA